MENIEKPSPMQVAMRFGLYYAFTAIIIDLIFYVLDLTYSWGAVIGILKTVGAFMVLYFAMIARKKELPGQFMSYSQGLGIGSLTVLFGSLIVSIYSLIYMKYIDPDSMERALAEVKRSMIAKNKPEEDIETTISMMQKMKSPAFAVSFMFIGSFINGFVLSLIAAIFTRKKDPNADYSNLDA